MKISILIALSMLMLFSCSKDEIKAPVVERPDEVNKVIDITNPQEKAGDITAINFEKMQEGYVLVNDAANNRVFLMEKLESKILTEWILPTGIGNDAEILDDGNLLVALMDEEPAFQFGGYGGRMAIISSEGNVLWDYRYSDQHNLSHHDIEMLPNGNVLFIAWERVVGDDLDNLGYTGGDDELFIEKLIEIAPSTNEIVWEWKSTDHLVQDQVAVLNNFGIISDHPEKIDINYVDEYKEGSYNGDTMHAKALEYDPVTDLIYLSVNFYSEVWVIDHSTTTEDAKTDTGGNFDKGGDLVYRFGNPDAYQNNSGERMFYHNHNPTLVPDSNRILVFSNGIPAVDSHSTVYELELPLTFDLGSNLNNELEVVWSFEHEDLFSAKVSGAHRLPNGNTLITEGTSGYWEVTEEKEVVWKFEGDGFFWRGYHYDLNSPALQQYNLGNL